MSQPNLADPDYEPTDEEFRELMRRAFAGVKEAHEKRLRELHEAIEANIRKDRERLPEAGTGR